MMKYMYVGLMLGIHLCLFGAAYDKEVVAYAALEVEPSRFASMMEITPGENNLPFTVAFKSLLHRPEVIACIVADEKLKENFSEDIAQNIVDDCATDRKFKYGPACLSIERLNSRLQKLCIQGTRTEALRCNITRPYLVTLFLFSSWNKVEFYTLGQKPMHTDPGRDGAIGYKLGGSLKDWSKVYTSQMLTARRELARRKQTLPKSMAGYALRIDFDSAKINQVLQQELYNKNKCLCQVL